MRIVRWLVGIALVMATVAVVTPAPAEASVLYRRIADANQETFATRTSGAPQLRMQPPNGSEAQQWIVVEGYATLITMIIAYPSGGCWQVDEAGGAGAPLRLADPCRAGDRTQEWWTEAHPDGVQFRNIRTGRCAGFRPGEAQPVLRALTCDGSPGQGFTLPPYT
jgi:hypothetical protein